MTRHPIDDPDMYPVLTLLDDVNPPPKTVAQLGTLFARLVPLFVQIVQDLKRVDVTVSGNGNGVIGLNERMRRIEDRLPPKTSFNWVIWFLERVLPTLVATAIGGAIVWIASVNRLLPP